MAARKYRRYQAGRLGVSERANDRSRGADGQEAPAGHAADKLTDECGGENITHTVGSGSRPHRERGSGQAGSSPRNRPAKAALPWRGERFARRRLGIPHPNTAIPRSWLGIPE